MFDTESIFLFKLVLFFSQFALVIPSLKITKRVWMT